ncbi:MAG: outer membrane protein assembly factor BamD [Piscirickettsiaceae bacterium]|nr:outer membrane protein assembly factor BamD [Piscirickettsiaceae bacterium]
MQKYYLTLTALSLIIMSGCSYSTTTTHTIDNSLHKKQIYNEATKALNSGDYSTALKNYDTLKKKFPFTSYLRPSLLRIVYMSYRKHDLKNALVNINSYILKYPRSKNMDYVLYLRGLINLNMVRMAMNYHATDIVEDIKNRNVKSKHIKRYIFQEDASQRDIIHAHSALKDFITLVDTKHSSEYRKDSIMQIIYIHKILAKHELNVANYYMRHKKYTSASERSKNIIKDYPHTSDVPAALSITAKVYKITKHNKESDDILQILTLNYPSHHVIKEIIDTKLK